MDFACTFAKYSPVVGALHIARSTLFTLCAAMFPTG